MEKKVSGWSFLLLSISAFGGLGLEAIYAYLLEPIIYGQQMQEWNTMQSIIHWIITCITWGIVAFWLFKTSKKNYQFDLMVKGTKMNIWQWVGLLLCVAFNLTINYLDWNGFKIIITYQRFGALKFTFQYLYYAVETILFMLIIVFAQKAFEVWFKRPNIPYGGIICGITWGFVHAFTKGCLWIGIEGIIIGFTYGVVYLLLNRDIKRTYPILFIMFML